jgi:hypothetical protein
MSAMPDRFETDRPGSADPYAEWDAAYVLGALSPAERLEFEGHLSGCDRCRAAVAEIAGVPGLLAQVGPADAARLTEAPDLQDGLPGTVLPEVLATVRRERSRLSRALLTVAAGIALVLGGFGLAQVLDPFGADAPQHLAFAAVAPSTITANVDLVPISTGTRVEVECQYGAATDPDPMGHYARYSVVVTDRQGRTSVIKDWPVSTNKVMRPSGTTPLAVSEIRDVQIRQTATDEVVLQARVH